MSNITTLVNLRVIETPDNKIWAFDKLAGMITLYANSTQYDVENPIGTIPVATFLAVARKLLILESNA